MKSFTNSINKLFGSIFLFATAVGMNFVTFPAVLTKNGINPAKIGIASACEICGGILMSLALSHLIKRINGSKFLLLISGIYTFSICVIFFYKSYILWVLTTFIMGACWVAYVVFRQALLNISSSDANRGLITGIYSTLISVGLALGPLIVKFSGAEKYISFVISSLLVLFSYWIIDKSILLKDLKITSQKTNFFAFIKDDPRCFLGRFFFDFQNFFFLSFTVVFGKKIGLSAENAGLLITAFMSSFFADLVVGMILKKFDPYKMINVGFVGYLLIALIIALFYEYYNLMLIVYFTLGIFAACIYVSTIVIVNNKHKENLLESNAALQTTGSLGSLLGGICGGIFMEVFSVSGYAITIIFSSSCYLIFLLISHEKSEKDGFKLKLRNLSLRSFFRFFRTRFQAYFRQN